MKKRIIALLLVLAMLALALASCGDGKNPEVTDEPTATTTKAPDTPDAPATTTKGGAATTAKPQGGDTPAATTTKAPAVTTAAPELDWWEDVNYNGESIIISLSNYEPAFVISAGATNGIKYIKGPDAYTTDSVQNAVYDRNNKVVDQLGLTVTYQECNQYNSSPDNTLTVIENFVLADLEDSPDIVNTMSYGVVRAGIKGLLYNALDTSRENYFDLSANGWYSDFMYENTLDESKIYMLAGDYFIDTLRYAYGILVNIDMYDEVFASEGGSDSLFELIKAGDWTYDEYKRCIQNAYVDAGTAGQLDAEDTFGAINHASWLTRASFSTSGLDVFTTDENGKIAYITDITDVHNFVDDLISLTKTEGFYLNMSGGPNTSLNQNETFTNGKALFNSEAPILTLEGTLIQNMDDSAGLIPYPKYSPDTEYGALLSDNGNVGGILYSSDKFTECSAFLQMSTELSNGGRGTLVYEYYDVTLKYKLSATPAQVTMLELIRDGITSPKSMLYDNYFAKSVGMQSYGTLMNQCLASGMNSFASSWESQIGAVQGSLESTLTTYGQQD